MNYIMYIVVYQLQPDTRDSYMDAGPSRHEGRYISVSASRQGAVPPSNLKTIFLFQIMPVVLEQNYNFLNKQINVMLCYYSLKE